MSELCVTAFRRTQCLDNDSLIALKNFHFNGIQLSYEEGYVEVGGRTVYIVLSQGFVSKRNRGVFLTVSEFKPISVRPLSEDPRG